MKPFWTTVLLMSIATSFAPSSFSQTPGPPSTEPQLELATIHVYRRDRDLVAFWFLTKTLPVYFGDHGQALRELPKIAGIRNKQYFVMRVPAGNYYFDTYRMSGKLELDLAAGGEYYLRVDRGRDCAGGTACDPYDRDGCEDRNPSIEIVPPAVAIEEMSSLKPIAAKNIKDRKLVSIPKVGDR